MDSATSTRNDNGSRSRAASGVPHAGQRDPRERERGCRSLTRRLLPEDIDGLQQQGIRPRDPGTRALRPRSSARAAATTARSTSLVAVVPTTARACAIGEQPLRLVEARGAAAGRSRHSFLTASMHQAVGSTQLNDAVHPRPALKARVLLDRRMIGHLDALQVEQPGGDWPCLRGSGQSQAMPASGPRWH